MYRKNTAGQFICVQLLLTATGAVATGLTPAARRCIDGTFAAGTGTFTEDGTTGSYKYALSQADTNGNDISIIVTATGAMPVCVNLVTTAADPTSATSFGLTNLDATITSRMASYTQPSGFLAATFPTGTVANTTNITAGTITTTTNLTNAATVGDLTAAMKTSLATAVWTDTTASDFTTALSVGKSVMNGVSLGTGLTVNDITTKTGYSLSGTQTFNVTGNITGNLSGSVGSVTGAVGSVTGLTASNLDAAVSSRMATYTQPAGFLAAAFPGTVASPTNITAIVGNITGNLSGSVGSVTGNVGGSVASVTARVTANADQIAGNATAASNVTNTMQAIVRGTCSGGTTSTAICSSITSPTSLTAGGQLIGRTILFDAGTATAALQGQASNITASTTGSTPTITFTAMTTAPANGDTFSII